MKLNTLEVGVVVVVVEEMWLHTWEVGVGVGVGVVEEVQLHTLEVVVGVEVQPV